MVAAEAVRSVSASAGGWSKGLSELDWSLFLFPLSSILLFESCKEFSVVSS